ncbi:MAG: hypothetical protein DRN12_03150 [Thermoplasmata archaeon]|nr:MAG: hypothetical protein DRN12_03150 [Thermoplasmata archaeon]
MKKFIVIGILIVSLSCYTTNGLTNAYNKDSTSYAIINVDDEGDGDFTSIQTAISEASPGDTIRVYSGTYNENIEVDKENLTIEGINYELGTGDDNGYPSIIGDGNDDVVKITSDNISFSGFIIQNSGKSYYDAGIEIHSNNSEVFRNGLTGNFYGVVINYCHKNVVRENYIAGNTMDGIYMMYTSDNIISNNQITENGFQGVFLYDADDNEIKDNILSLNGKDGIHLRNLCAYNTISDNTIYSNNIDGIKLWEPGNNYNTIIGNEIYSNRFNGIHIMNSNNNEIYENEIKLNLLNGIHIGDASDNIIQRNTIRDSFSEGIMILGGDSNNNLIYYNNIINDTALDNGNNIWDSGYPSGGNYWSYYSGTDNDNDGIGDIPYDIPGSGGNQDRYPFIKPLQPPNKPTKPKGPTLGKPGVEYIYQTSAVDPNGNKIQYGWDWNGDKKVDFWSDFYNSGVTANASHSWDQQGDYQIYVIAMDQQGFKSEWSEPLTVTMPKTYANLLDLLYHHINLYYVLEKLMLDILMRMY